MAEEDELVFLQSLGELDGIVIVVVLHRVTKSLVVLLLNQKIIDSRVDHSLVLSLNIEKERLDDWNIVRLLEHTNDSVDVNSRCQGLQEICEKKWLLLQVVI